MRLGSFTAPARAPLVLAAALLQLVAATGARAGMLPEAMRQRLRDSPIVGRELVDALDAAPRARVMLVFAEPATKQARTRLRRRAAIRDTAAELADSVGGELAVRRRYGAIPALAGEITAAGVLRLMSDPRVRRIDLDTGGSGGLAEAVPLSALDVVQSLGFTGRGVTVAQLDSGVDTDHPDLADSLADEHCFCSGGGCCPNGLATQSGPGSAEDDHGHGTNVAGIITSNGTIAPRGGAPDAALVAVKVLDHNNAFCCVSDVVAGLDWVLDHHPEVGIVSMSLGTSALFPDSCDTATANTIALAAAVDALTDAGVAVFASAGNQGSGTRMSAPACVANAISVGAVYDADVGEQRFGICTDRTTRADQVTCFSNSNATTDLFAPGAPITSTGRGGGRSTISGTSQATPLAAACAADLRQAVPHAAPARIDAALRASAVRVTDTTNRLSFPRLDCAQALDTLTMPLCSAAPKDGCAPATRSLLLVRDTDGAANELLWAWLDGATTPGAADFGDPTRFTDYGLCLYAGTSAALVAQAELGSSATRWDRIGPQGFRYVDPTGSASGIRRLSLRSSRNQETRAVVRGEGPWLPALDLLGVPAPIVVQLVNSDNATCLQATYADADITNQDTHLLRAQNQPPATPVAVTRR